MSTRRLLACLITLTSLAPGFCAASDDSAGSLHTSHEYLGHSRVLLYFVEKIDGAATPGDAAVTTAFAAPRG